MNTNRQNAPAVENAGDEGLVRNPATGYWTAQGRRVPLVGAGRTIDDLSSAIVEVLSANKGLNNVTDLDITNCADFSGVRVNAVGNRIISVKDMYRTYAPGQKVGFVLGNNENTVLGADVLSFFVIQLYNDGQPAGEFRLGESDGETLNLDVLKLTSTGNNGQQVIEVTAEQPFDEVALGMAGVGADIGEGSLGVYYAFVGETPEEDIYSDTGASIKTGIINWTSVADAHPEDLLDSNDPQMRKLGARRVVSLMRSGENMSCLFSSMLRCVKTSDLSLKKLAYLYLVNYSSQEPEQAIMVVNTFVTDSTDGNPIVRALAVRSMCRIKLDAVAEHMIIPLKKSPIINAELLKKVPSTQ